MDLELHPDVAHLAPYVGTWRGEGRGEYPTIEPFGFTEETVFDHVGKPFLSFVQRTRDLGGSPLHTEVGYLRPVGVDHVEFLITMPSGVVESLEGSVDGARLELASVAVVRAATAKEVTATRRSYVIEPDPVDGVATLRWSFAMEAVGHPMTHHLSGVLRRT